MCILLLILSCANGFVYGLWPSMQTGGNKYKQKATQNVEREKTGRANPNLAAFQNLKKKKKQPDSHRGRGKHEHDEAIGNKSK